MPAEELAELIVAEMAPIADGNAPNAKQHKAAVAAAIRKASDHQLLPAEDIERLRERLRSSGAESAANAICSYLDQAKDEIRRRAEEQKPLLEWRHNRPKLHFGSAAFAKLKKRLQDKNLQLSNGQWQEAAEFAAGISKHNVRPPRDPLTSEHDEDSAGEKILTSAENKARAFEKAGMRGKSASEVRTGFRVH